MRRGDELFPKRDDRKLTYSLHLACPSDFDNCRREHAFERPRCDAARTALWSAPAGHWRPRRAVASTEASPGHAFASPCRGWLPPAASSPLLAVDVASRCLLLGLFGRGVRAARGPLVGVERTSIRNAGTSESDPNRTLRAPRRELWYPPSNAMGRFNEAADPQMALAARAERPRVLAGLHDSTKWPGIAW